MRNLKFGFLLLVALSSLALSACNRAKDRERDFVSVERAADPEPDRDFALLEFVLTDLLAWDGSPVLPSPPRDPDAKILFSLETSKYRGQTWDRAPSDLLHQHYAENWKAVLPDQVATMKEAAENLVRRLAEKDPFEGFIPKNKRIVIWDKTKDDEERDSKRSPFGPPRFRPQVFHSCAPGYSSDGRIAIVRLSFPWGMHSGDVTYVLTNQDDGWDILVRERVIYL